MPGSQKDSGHSGTADIGRAEASQMHADRRGNHRSSITLQPDSRRVITYPRDSLV
jgi:hypothetical protein